MSNKKLNAQARIFKELENQLLVQAERLGIRDDFDPMRMKDIQAKALDNHILSFYAERSNLEYEMQMFGTDKKELLIKLERLELYIKRAERLKKSFEQEISKLLDKLVPEKERALKATRRQGTSVNVGGN